MLHSLRLLAEQSQPQMLEPLKDEGQFSTILKVKSVCVQYLLAASCWPFLAMTATCLMLVLWTGGCVLLGVFGYNLLATAEVGVQSLAVHLLLEVTPLLETDARHLSHTGCACEVSQLILGLWLSC